MAWRHATLDEAIGGRYPFQRLQVGHPIQVWDGPGNPPGLSEKQEKAKPMNEQKLLRKLDSLSAGIMCACILGGINLGVLILVIIR